MLIQRQPPLHLTYCLNVHPGVSWQQHLDAIRDKAVAVRDAVCPQGPFGLGLRISAEAARTLLDEGEREALKSLLAAEGMYAFTINGFPYGDFHGTRVKENVYAPDWRSHERLTYTNTLADILADILPEGETGSISTVPGSFKAWINSQADLDAMTRNLLACVEHMAAVRDRTGRLIRLALEPEPACFLETTAEAIAFFEERLLREGPEALVREHLGVCFDTCHVALQFEDLVGALDRFKAAGIGLYKVQLSAALETTGSPEGLAALRPFDEPVYLHQARALQQAGGITSWTDLPDMMSDAASIDPADKVRVHFHVPLFWEGGSVLHSTARQLDDAFFERLRDGLCPHLEIETYTFDVLPEDMRSGGVVESIAREYACMLPRFAADKAAS